MEQPPSQLTWHKFIHWYANARQSADLPRTTMRDIAHAWEEYKRSGKAKVSPSVSPRKRISPTRRSPRRSKSPSPKHESPEKYRR